MEATEQNGKYVLQFNTRAEAELHIAATQALAAASAPEATEHATLAERFKHLVARLGHHGIAAADQPLPATNEPVDLNTSQSVIAAPDGQGSKPPVITKMGLPITVPSDEKADALAAEEGN